MPFEIFTSADRPDLNDAAAAAFRGRWPELIFHDAISNQYVLEVEARFGRCDILLLQDGDVAAGGWGVPFLWDGTPSGLPQGYRTALVTAVEEHGRVPNAFSFMAAAVAEEFDSQGLATRVLSA